MKNSDNLVKRTTQVIILTENLLLIHRGMKGFFFTVFAWKTTTDSSKCFCFMKEMKVKGIV